MLLIYHIEKENTINNESIGDLNVLVEILGEYFSYINSNNNYTNDFILIKNQKELVEITFEKKRIWYNNRFTLIELETALDSCTGSSPGPDFLHYAMFKELSIQQKYVILQFINYLWINDQFPDAWRIATVIPILKPGKIATENSSYRPISLTSCFCKIMEKWSIVD